MSPCFIINCHKHLVQKRKPKAKQAFTPGKTAFESVQAMMKNNKQFSKRINYNALKSALPDALDEKDDEDDEDFKEDETVVDEDEDPMREFKKMQYQSDHDPADFYEEV
jgi:Brf1-like TBP-binding domain